MPRSAFFVSRVSATSTSTRIVSPSSTGATTFSSPPSHAMPVLWMRPVCMTSPSDSAKVSARGATAEHRLALDELHVQEQRLGEAAGVDEVHDVGLRHRARQRPVHVAHLVPLEIDSLLLHVS